jgi:hypothetical protein
VKKEKEKKNHATKEKICMDTDGIYFNNGVFGQKIILIYF